MYRPSQAPHKNVYNFQNTIVCALFKFNSLERKIRKISNSFSCFLPWCNMDTVRGGYKFSCGFAENPKTLALSVPPVLSWKKSVETENNNTAAAHTVLIPASWQNACCHSCHCAELSDCLPPASSELLLYTTALRWEWGCSVDIVKMEIIHSTHSSVLLFFFSSPPRI